MNQFENSPDNLREEYLRRIARKLDNQVSAKDAQESIHELRTHLNCAAAAHEELGSSAIDAMKKSIAEMGSWKGISDELLQSFRTARPSKILLWSFSYILGTTIYAIGLALVELVLYQFINFGHLMGLAGSFCPAAMFAALTMPFAIYSKTSPARFAFLSLLPVGIITLFWFLPQMIVLLQDSALQTTKSFFEWEAWLIICTIWASWGMMAYICRHIVVWMEYRLGSIQRSNPRPTI